METIIEIFTDPSLSFLRMAMLVGIIASIPFGLIGTLVVTKRITFMAGSISHSILGGVGLGFYLQTQTSWSFIGPQIGATIFAIMSALIIGILTLKYKQREDTLIGVVWALGMSIGLIFLAKTPSYTDPMSYLFGNILLVDQHTLLIVILMALIILVTTILNYNRFFAICFDEEFARIRGVNTAFHYLFLLILTALTIVTMMNVVGIVLIIAMLTIPVAIASTLTNRLWKIMLFSTIICASMTVIGLIVSYHLDLPSGPIIVALSSCAYILSLVRSIVA